MTWIDDDLGELNRQRHAAAELAKTNKQISEAAETVYNDLWDELVQRIKEAESKGRPTIMTNGSSFQRMLIVPQPIKPPQTYSKRRELIFRLTKEKLAIVVEELDKKIVFPLELCEDQVVRLKYEGEHKCIKEVASSSSAHLCSLSYLTKM